MKHRVAAIGLASWDRFMITESYPESGSYAIVSQTSEQPGGTSANMLTALAKLGILTTLVTRVGDDVQGQSIREQLEIDGIDTRYVESDLTESTDIAVIVVSQSPAGNDRTIFWIKGARPKHGYFVPIEEVFSHDLVIVDTDDPKLRQFIVDLPMHVAPRTRLLGTLTYLTDLDPEHGLDLALRHDYVVGNERELGYLTGADEIELAISRFQDEMILSQTRFAVISRGKDGCVVFDRDSRTTLPAFVVDVVDTTGAGDAFAAGAALGILERKGLPDIGLLANALGALSTRVLGARAALPTRDELDAFLNQQREAGHR